MNFKALPQELREPKYWVRSLLIIVALYLIAVEIASIWNSHHFILKQEPLEKEKPKAIKSANAALFKADLFGPYVSQLSDEVVKKSSLNIVILGILYSQDKKKSQVLIKNPAGEEQIFGLEAALPGGAIIKKINEDSIIVLYRGSLESLKLPHEELSFYKPQRQI